MSKPFLKQLVTFIFIFTAILGYTQKANLETVQMYHRDAKYVEAYEIMNSEKFKYKEEQKDEYRYFYAVSCLQLYIATPELNSTYRNEGIINSAYLLVSDDATMQLQGQQIINYLTATIYRDIVPILNGSLGPDSIMFAALSNETLRCFKWFTVSDTVNTPALQYIGGSFYNDAAYMQSARSNNDSPLSSYEKSERMMYLMEIAELFYEILCFNREIDCEMHAFINSITRKPKD